MTLQAATVAVASTDTPRISFARVLGFSTDGSAGDLPITLLNENLTAQQVAGLVGEAIAADGRFTTSVSGANVTVTCAANGAVNAVTGAGNTGFAVTRLQAGITGALTYELIDAGQISSAAGWNELPCLVGFYATARPSAQTVSNNTARNLLTATQAPQGSKVVVNTPYGAYIVVNAALLSPNGSTPGSDAAFGPNLLAPSMPSRSSVTITHGGTRIFNLIRRPTPSTARCRANMPSRCSWTWPQLRVHITRELCCNFGKTEPWPRDWSM